jgi:hypothetical protein
MSNIQNFSKIKVIFWILNCFRLAYLKDWSKKEMNLKTGNGPPPLE